VNIVRRWLRRRYRLRSEEKEHIAKAPLKRASPRHTAWLMLIEPASATTYLKENYRQSPQIAAAANAAHEFSRIIRSPDFTAWHNWTQTARTTLLANFLAHLIRDQDAVLAALHLPWSNGQVEGHIYRLKLIKRQMYGHANFDLLRLRVLNAA
jgi:transposase